MTHSRRPLKSRDKKPMQKLAQALAKTKVTPNHISMASVGFAAMAALGFGLSIWHSPFWLLLAALGIQLRLLCNLIDGMVAIEGGKKAATGAFWNEVPDRFSDGLILVAMGYAAGFVALGWAATAGAIMTAYLREAAAAQGMAGDFSGPMAKPQRMAVATLAALVAIPFPVIGWNVLEMALWVIILGEIATIARRMRHYLDYLKANAGE